MSLPLRAVLNIRQTAEDKAAALVREAQAELNACEKLAHQLVDELSAFRLWRRQCEAELFAGVKCRQLGIPELHAYLNDVSGLNDQQQALEKQIYEAKHRLEDCAADLEVKKLELRSAIKAKEKYRELVAREQRELDTAVAYRDEMEQEEICETLIACANKPACC